MISYYHGILVELTSIRDKLTAAEKLRREKWVEAKQKEIKELTVKGLEPEIARLIARHKQVSISFLREYKARNMDRIMVTSGTTKYKSRT